MLKTFKTAFALRNTYMANSFIFGLRSLPIIKKILPATLYADGGLKAIANVYAIIKQFIMTFIGKLIYLLVMFFVANKVMKIDDSNVFITIFFFLTLVGAQMNNPLMNASKDKYYGIVLLRMDAKKYLLSNYFYFLIRMLVGMLPFTLIFGLLSGVSFWCCLLMPVLVVSVKLIACAITLWEKRRNVSQAVSEYIIPLLFIAAGCAAAYGLPLVGCTMSEFLFVVAVAAFLLLSIPATRYIMYFDDYRNVCKDILKKSEVFLNAGKKKTANAVSMRNMYQKKLDVTAVAVEDTKKTGYAYLNAVFVKRHSRFLTKSAKRISLISAALIVLLMALMLIRPESKTVMNKATLTYLPYALFIMYLLNPGRSITAAMFTNCDHCMLNYRFFRQPKAILSLFATRLKSVVLIGLMPALVLAVGMPLLLFLSGGTDNPLNYLVLFGSLIAMSVFFSVHNMVLYYLLQPYNADMEMKNPAFSIISTLTYVVCYNMVGRKLPTLQFGTVIFIFSIVYVIVALLLAYLLAPKTFHLRR